MGRGSMSPEEFALGVAGAVFAAGAAGLFLQHLLPEKFTTGGPRDMIDFSRSCPPSSSVS
jgi:hypothetical protein